jgi:hypothetical protein
VSLFIPLLGCSVKQNRHFTKMLIVSLHLSVAQDGLVAQAVVFRILPAVASPGCAYATAMTGGA